MDIFQILKKDRQTVKELYKDPRRKQRDIKRASVVDHFTQIFHGSPLSRVIATWPFPSI
jgi:hypothetical protein